MLPAIGPTFEALRPAIARLARARPLERHLTREALLAAGAGGLTVMSGEAEAIVRGTGRGRTAARRSSSGAGSRRTSPTRSDAWPRRARPPANAEFIAKAPAAVVEGAVAREAELGGQVDRSTGAASGTGCGTASGAEPASPVSPCRAVSP